MANIEHVNVNGTLYDIADPVCRNAVSVDQSELVISAVGTTPTSPIIVQTTGQATDKVMSQKAVTDQFTSQNVTIVH